MGTIRLGYSTFGLTALNVLDAIDAVHGAGFSGVELAFHRDQFNPFNIDDDDLAGIGAKLKAAHLKPTCVATASYFFTPSHPHEPSLIALERAGRKRRVDLIKRGIRVARRLGVPLVTFGSGFLRPAHARDRAIDLGELLRASIRECLQEIHDDEDITLLIEPEPGMYIETLAEALVLISDVNSPKFRLHLDICHAYCSEPDYATALAEAAPSTRYLHISDAHEGYNLKIVQDDEDLAFALDSASVLVHFPDTADYLLVDRKHPIYFCDERPSSARKVRIDMLLARAGIEKDPTSIDYSCLYAGASSLDDEIFTYLISIPRLSFDVLERAKPIIAYLRGAKTPPLIDKMVANTRTGIAHFHELPGEGTLDFAASFRALTENGFSGDGSVELYHHVASWKTALADSYRHLARLTDGT